MKAIIEFNLDEGDDMNLRRCTKALDMSLVIWEFFYNTRKEIERKLDADEKIDRYTTIDLICEKFKDLLDEHHIDIDELVE